MSLHAPRWPRFGVHAGFYGGVFAAEPAAELRRLWSAADEMGFDWVSVWDHFFDPTSTEAGYCFDVVSMQSAIACTTERARCGALVYCAAYRHPLVIASAISTIDHLSGGRAELGLGAGWSEGEFRASGVPFLPFEARIAMLEETVECVRRLLDGGTVTFEGRHFRLEGARCHPGPVQVGLPIWLGGRSAAVARLAARTASGLNLPYVGPEVVRRRREQAAMWAAEAGRSTEGFRLSVNLALALDHEDYERQFANVVDHVRAGVVVGGVAEITAAATALVDAGADQVNFTVRAPFRDDLLDVLAAVLGELRSASS